MVAHLPNDIGVVWAKGSHYANVYEGWNSPNNIDCFSFAFEKNKTSMLDFTESLAVYLDRCAICDNENDLCAGHIDV
jgi:hypothetical protein